MEAAVLADARHTEAQTDRCVSCGGGCLAGSRETRRIYCTAQAAGERGTREAACGARLDAGDRPLAPLSLLADRRPRAPAVRSTEQPRGEAGGQAGAHSVNPWTHAPVPCTDGSVTASGRPLRGRSHSTCQRTARALAQRCAAARRFDAGRHAHASDAWAWPGRDEPTSHDGTPIRRRERIGSQ